MTTIRRVLALTVAMMIGALLFTASPVSAHTGFESSSPADGATVEQAVGEIVLQFSGAAEPAGEGFVVLDPAGIVRSPDLTTADPERQAWTLNFDPPLADGTVGVRWTVQAPDAHPIEGSFSFTITAPNPDPLVEENIDGVGATGEIDEAESEAVKSAPASATDDPESGVDATFAPDTGSQSETATQNLDQFLTQPAASAPNAEGIGAFGRLVGFIGTMLGIGGLTFAAVVIRDHRKDTLSVLKAVRYSGAIVVVGTIIDSIAHLAVANNGWTSLWSMSAIESVGLSAFGLAIGLRIGAGALLYAAAALTARGVAGVTSVVANEERVLVGAGPSFGHDEIRWDAPSPTTGDGIPISPEFFFAVLVLLASFTFDGHTVTEGNRWITGAVDMIHVVAGSIWTGGVVAFAVVLWRRHRCSERLNALELAARFSIIAGAALAAAGIAGTALAVIILDAASELWSTPWGLLLIAKFVAVFAAASLGTYNHFVVVPWMEAHPTDDGRSIRLRNTVTGEAALLFVVITVTAFLVGAAS